MTGHGFSSRQAYITSDPLPQEREFFELSREEIWHASSTRKNCNLCAQDFQNGDKIRRLQCEDIFHETCLEARFRTQDWHICNTCGAYLHDHTSEEEKRLLTLSLDVQRANEERETEAAMGQLLRNEFNRTCPSSSLPGSKGASS